MAIETRAILLKAAAAILGDEGPTALTVRNLAEAVGGSTKMIYTHFGGKDGLFEALYLHSFDTFTNTLAAVPPDADPAMRLRAMTTAYRDFALQEPAFYNVMFGDLGRAWQAPLACRRQAWRSFETLCDGTQAALPKGREREAVRITYLLWAAMHGVVSLELRKLIGKSESACKLFEMAVEAVLVAHDVGGARKPAASDQNPAGQS